MSLAASPSKLSILIVDDEEPVRDVLGWLLEDQGHAVYPAADGYKALAFLRVERPVDIVLSDINMPGMDGLALCKLIETEFPNLPVLLISGRPRPDGVKAFVAKPFRVEVLTSEIEQLVSAVRTAHVGRLQHAH
ncbi:MAG: response regulator [Janthinobacterium lividum]